MSKKSTPKTEGLTWLEHSFIAFNGSGYRDAISPERFVDSYILYNKWKKRLDAAELATRYYKALLPLAEHLIEISEGANKVTSQKNLTKFHDYATKNKLATLFD